MLLHLHGEPSQRAIPSSPPHLHKQHVRYPDDSSLHPPLRPPLTPVTKDGSPILTRRLQPAILHVQVGDAHESLAVGPQRQLQHRRLRELHTDAPAHNAPSPRLPQVSEQPIHVRASRSRRNHAAGPRRGPPGGSLAGTHALEQPRDKLHHVVVPPVSEPGVDKLPVPNQISSRGRHARTERTSGPPQAARRAVLRTRLIVATSTTLPRVPLQPNRDRRDPQQRLRGAHNVARVPRPPQTRETRVPALDTTSPRVPRGHGGQAGELLDRHVHHRSRQRRTFDREQAAGAESLVQPLPRRPSPLELRALPRPDRVAAPPLIRPVSLQRLLLPPQTFQLTQSHLLGEDRLRHLPRHRLPPLPQGLHPPPGALAVGRVHIKKPKEPIVVRHEEPLSFVEHRANSDQVPLRPQRSGTPDPIEAKPRPSVVRQVLVETVLHRRPRASVVRHVAQTQIPAELGSLGRPNIQIPEEHERTSSVRLQHRLRLLRSLRRSMLVRRQVRAREDHVLGPDSAPAHDGGQPAPYSHTLHPKFSPSVELRVALVRLDSPNQRETRRHRCRRSRARALLQRQDVHLQPRDLGPDAALLVPDSPGLGRVESAIVPSDIPREHP